MTDHKKCSIFFFALHLSAALSSLKVYVQIYQITCSTVRHLYPGITIFLEIFLKYRYTGKPSITISRFNDIILTSPWHIVKPGFHWNSVFDNNGLLKFVRIILKFLWIVLVFVEDGFQIIQMSFTEYAEAGKIFLAANSLLLPWEMSYATRILNYLLLYMCSQFWIQRAR